MGLDVALGILILIAAIRGWIQGFTYQAVRMVGLIACVYLAAPARERARPYVAPYLPSIPPEWMDRILWWSAAAVVYVLVVGCATLAIRMARGPETVGAPSSARRDQFAGFLVGMAKGALVAAFLTAGVHRLVAGQLLKADWANQQIQEFMKAPWADQQIQESMAIRWDERYQPASKIWSSAPVQHFVQRFRERGPIRPDSPGPREKDAAAREKIVNSELESAVDDIRSALDAAATAKPASPQLQLRPSVERR